MEEADYGTEAEGQPIQHLKAGGAFYDPADVRVAKFNNTAMWLEFVVFYLLGEHEQETVRALAK